jgi:hypothetical protein
MSARDGTITHGNDWECACPWCDKPMNMHDDGRWSDDGDDECEHCERPFRRLHDLTVHVTCEALLVTAPAPAKKG